MTFILGTSRLTYDHFGDYPNLQTVAEEQVVAGITGDSSTPGEMQPGTFMPGETHETFLLEVEVL